MKHEDFKLLLKSLAKMQAVKACVEHAVIGDCVFDNTEESTWPYARIDGINANYYTFFKNNYLLDNVDINEGDDCKAAFLSLKNLIEALERNDESKIFNITDTVF